MALSLSLGCCRARESVECEAHQPRKEDVVIGSPPLRRQRVLATEAVVIGLNVVQQIAQGAAGEFLLSFSHFVTFHLSFLS